MVKMVKMVKIDVKLNGNGNEFTDQEFSQDGRQLHGDGNKISVQWFDQDGRQTA